MKYYMTYTYSVFHPTETRIDIELQAPIDQLVKDHLSNQFVLIPCVKRGTSERIFLGIDFLKQSRIENYKERGGVTI
jgi:hypothetical protein